MAPTERLALGPIREAVSADERRGVPHRRGPRRAGRVLATATAVVVAVAGLLWGLDARPGGAFTGAAAAGVTGRDVVVEVRAGDSLPSVAHTLVQSNVVGSAEAFLQAAQSNSVLASVQPGFYKLRSAMTAADAVARLADPQYRVGQVVVEAGRQLDDVVDAGTGAVTPGIMSLISRASCVELDGQQRCVSVADLRHAAAGTAPGELSVPGWAAQPVAAMTGDHRRLEGLIAAGTWNFDPLAPPQQIMASLIDASAKKYDHNAVLVMAAEELGVTPYQVLTVASLVQREGGLADYPRVAATLYDRLNSPEPLRLDSTVSFQLARQGTVDDSQRAAATPWNTFVLQGLPATPICSPSDPALAAAEHPM